ERPEPMTRRRFLASQYLLVVVVAFSAGSPARAEPPATLPGTELLTGPDDRSGEMMDGLHRYIEQKIADSVNHRAQYWHRDFSSREAYEKSIERNRARFRKMIGVVDNRLPVRFEFFAQDSDPGYFANTKEFHVYQVRWPVLE